MKPHKTTCKITLKHDNGDLIDDFPPTEEASISFDATDISIHVWTQQFKKVLAVAGFAEQTINEYLGEY